MRQRLKRVWRNARDSRAARWLMAATAAGYIRLCWNTIRWTREEPAASRVVFDSGRPFILAFWHGRIAQMAPLKPETPVKVRVLVSNNRDGELISAVMARFNLAAVRGSTYDRRKGRGKGGEQAFREMTTALAAGEALAITPDGPRGPRMRAQLGVARASMASGAPVAPAAFSTKGGWFLNSWDRFLIPRPFTKGAMVFAELLYPPEDGDDEAFAERIEESLNAVTRRADAMVGRVTPEPGPKLGEPLG